MKTLAWISDRARGRSHRMQGEGGVEEQGSAPTQAAKPAPAPAAPAPAPASSSLVVTAADKADYTRCDLAIQTAGWHDVPAAFPCGAAPISHDGGVTARIDRFEATRAGADDELRIAWTEETFGGDAVRTSYELTCKVPAAGAPTCAPKRATR